MVRRAPSSQRPPGHRFSQVVGRACNLLAQEAEREAALCRSTAATARLLALLARLIPLRRSRLPLLLVPAGAPVVPVALHGALRQQSGMSSLKMGGGHRQEASGRRRGGGGAGAVGKSVLAVLTYCSGGCSGVHPSGRAESPARRGPPSVAPAACSPPPAGVVLALIALILRMEGAPGPTSLLRQLLTCVRSPAACWSLLPFGHLRCVAAQRSGGASSFMPHEGTRRRCAAAHI